MFLTFLSMLIWKKISDRLWVLLSFSIETEERWFMSVAPFAGTPENTLVFCNEGVGQLPYAELFPPFLELQVYCSSPDTRDNVSRLQGYLQTNAQLFSMVFLCFSQKGFCSSSLQEGVADLLKKINELGISFRIFLFLEEGVWRETLK